MSDAKLQSYLSGGKPLLVQGDHPCLLLWIDCEGHLVSPTTEGSTKPVALLEVWLQQKTRLECHERWEYNDDRHIQKLVGLEALCPSCHEVRHIGRSLSVGRGHLAIQHMSKVNQWTPEQVEAHIQQAMRQWNVRSRFVWKLNLEWLKTLPTEFGVKSVED